MGAPLHWMDRERAKLQDRHPGWNIWYVPRACGPTVWCAQREPLLNTDSPDHLSEAIREVERESEP